MVSKNLILQKNDDWYSLSEYKTASEGSLHPRPKQAVRQLLTVIFEFLLLRFKGFRNLILYQFLSWNWIVGQHVKLSEVKQILESTAVDLGPKGKDKDYGSGRIDAYKELERNNLRNAFFNSNEIMEQRMKSFKYSVKIESSYFAAGT